MLKSIFKILILIIFLGVAAAVLVPRILAPSQPDTSAQNADNHTSPPNNPPSSAVVKSATKGLLHQRDQVKGIDWYETKALRTASSGVFLYIGVVQGKLPWLSVVFRYHGQHWVFAQKILVRADETLLTLTPNDWTRDNDTTVWEIADLRVTPVELAIIRQIITSKQSILRFEGKDKQQDITIPDSMKQDLQRVLKAYEMMGGTIS